MFSYRILNNRLILKFGNNEYMIIEDGDEFLPTTLCVPIGIDKRGIYDYSYVLKQLEDFLIQDLTDKLVEEITIISDIEYIKSEFIKTYLRHPILKAIASIKKTIAEDKITSRNRLLLL